MTTVNPYYYTQTTDSTTNKRTTDTTSSKKFNIGGELNGSKTTNDTEETTTDTYEKNTPPQDVQEALEMAKNTKDKKKAAAIISKFINSLPKDEQKAEALAEIISQSSNGEELMPALKGAFEVLKGKPYLLPAVSQLANVDEALEKLGESQENSKLVNEIKGIQNEQAARAFAKDVSEQDEEEQQKMITSRLAETTDDKARKALTDRLSQMPFAQNKTISNIIRGITPSSGTINYNLFGSLSGTAPQQGQTQLATQSAAQPTTPRLGSLTTGVKTATT